MIVMSHPPSVLLQASADTMDDPPCTFGEFSYIKNHSHKRKSFKQIQLANCGLRNGWNCKDLFVHSVSFVSSSSKYDCFLERPKNLAQHWLGLIFDFQASTVRNDFVQSSQANSITCPDIKACMSCSNLEENIVTITGAQYIDLFVQR